MALEEEGGKPTFAALWTSGGSAQEAVHAKGISEQFERDLALKLTSALSLQAALQPDHSRSLIASWPLWASESVVDYLHLVRILPPKRFNKVWLNLTRKRKVPSEGGQFVR